MSGPSSIYSCSIDRILEYVFCHLGCWAVKGKFLKRPNFYLSTLLFGVFSWAKFLFFILFLILCNLKKPPQKVAYLSRNSVVSEIFLLLPNSPNGRSHVPKCGLQSNCIQNWGCDSIEKFYFLVQTLQCAPVLYTVALQATFQNMTSAIWAVGQ